MQSLAQQEKEVKPTLSYEEIEELETAEQLAFHWQVRATRDRTCFAARMAREFTEKARALAARFGQTTCVPAWEGGKK